MASRHFIVIDAGTSSLRCLVFDDNASIVGLASAEWQYRVEQGVSPFARSFDPEWVWRTFCDLIAQGLQEGNTPDSSVGAIAITSQRQAVAFMDGKGNEVYLGPNLDLRAVFEGGEIDHQLADVVYSITGHLPSFLFTPAKLLWFKDHRPESYERIAFVLTLADWLAWRLSGVVVSEPTLAGEAGLLDIHRRTWCNDLLRELSLEVYETPLHQAGTTIGRLGSLAAEQAHLPAGIPVVIGGADTQCGLLGLGAVRDGQVGVVAGWSAPVQMVTPRPVLSPERSMWAGCALEGKSWLLESSPGDLGNSYRWLAEVVFGGSPGAYARMDDLASSVPAGSDGVTAVLSQPRMEAARIGMRPGGVIMPMPLVFSDIGHGHLARAYLESITYAIRSNVEQAEELAGVPAASVAVGGGMTRTASFTRILADVLGREVMVASTPQSSAFGAYLCARTAVGDFACLKEAAALAEAQLRPVEPDCLASAEYTEHYERWRRLAEHLQRVEI